VKEEHDPTTGRAPRSDGRCLDGISLATDAWKVAPMRVERVESSFFGDRALFPEGSVRFDCALLMRDVPHEWRSEPAIVLDRAGART
jgi:hypothetical protein